MRRLILLPFVLIACTSPAQIRSWEKLIEPGLSYRMEMDLNKPLVWHAIRWSPQSKTTRATSELAGGTVYGAKDDDLGRETVAEMAKRTGAIAAINGDFFPWNGDPLGAMVHRGELISTPRLNRAVFAWGADYSAFGRLTFEGSVKAGSRVFPLAGVNEECPDNGVVINAAAAGRALSKDDAAHVLISISRKLPMNGVISGKVIRALPKGKTADIPAGQAVLTGRGTSMAGLEGLAPGTDLAISTSTIGLDSSKIEEAIGGGPSLIEKGAVNITTLLEGFKEDFSTTRHPRTAIGRTAEGDLWFVVVDGRQPNVSRGASLAELAEVMQKLGCTDALNLDGGGSSGLSIAGSMINRPSDQAPRPVANGILFYLTRPFQVTVDPVESPEFVIQGRARLSMGTFNTYRVVDSKGADIPNAEVLWTATGSAWVDQGGMLRGIQTGDAMVRASVRGRVISAKVTVEAG